MEEGSGICILSPSSCGYKPGKTPWKQGPGMGGQGEEGPAWLGRAEDCRLGGCSVFCLPSPGRHCMSSWRPSPPAAQVLAGRSRSARAAMGWRLSSGHWRYFAPTRRDLTGLDGLSEAQMGQSLYVPTFQEDPIRGIPWQSSG